MAFALVPSPTRRPTGRSAATNPPPGDAITAIGHELATAMDRRRPLRARADDAVMARMTADPRVKAALFRLVDVRPACADARELGTHLAALLDEVDAADAPVGVHTARRFADGRFTAAATGRVVAVGVGQMAGRFIVGADAAASVPALRRLWEDGVTTTVDLLGEATVTAAEADAYAARCADALEVLCAAAATWPAREGHLERDAAGPIPRVNLSVKVSALTPHLRPDAPQRGIDDAGARLRPLLRRARDLGAHLHVDMESLDDREAVLGTALSLLDEAEFRDGPSAGIVLQAYLKDAPAHLDEILRRVRASGRTVPLTIRLVKGAYWDHELVHAQQLGWEIPVWEDRASCDRCFESLTRRLLEAVGCRSRPHGRRDGPPEGVPLVRPAIASHNLRSVAHALAVQEELDLARGDVEYQILRGLGDDLQGALAARGLRVRAYCPVGDLVSGMAYLVRRLLENSSNDSFLHARQSGADLDDLLRAP